MQDAIHALVAEDPSLRGVTIETVPFPPIVPTHIMGTVDLLKAADAPDLLVLPAPFYATWLHDAGGILSLAEPMGRNDVLRDNMQSVYPAVRAALTLDGEIIAVPRIMQPTLMLYNEEDVAQAGVEILPDWTWDDMLIIAETLRGNAAFTSGRELAPEKYPIIVCMDPECFQPFVWSNGGDYLDFAEGQVVVDSVSNQQTFQWLQRAVSSGLIGAVMPTRTEWLKNGTTAMMLGSASLLSTLNAQGVKYLAAPVPRSSFTGQSVTEASPSVYVINAYSDQLQLALTYLAATLSHDAQAVAARETSGLPVRYGTPLPHIPGLSADQLATIARNAKVRPQTRLLGYFAPFQYDLVDTVLHGHMTVEQFLTEVQAGMEHIVANQPEPLHMRQAAATGSFLGPAPGGPPALDPDASALAERSVHIKWLTMDRRLVSAVNDFNRSQTEIGIEPVRPQGANYVEALRNGLAQGMYDMVDIPGTVLPELAATGLILSLDRFVAAGAINLAHDGGLSSQQRVDGVLYSLPLQRSTHVVWAKRTAWDRAAYAMPTAGWTWDTFRSWATKVTDPMRDVYGVITDGTEWRIPLMQDGTWDETLFAVRRHELAIFKDLMSLYPASVPTVTHVPVVRDVVEGRAASRIDTANPIGTTWSTARGIDHVGLMLLPLPTLDGTRVSWGSVAHSVGVAANTKETEAVIDFLAWLVSSAGGKAMVQSTDPPIVPANLHPDVVQELARMYGPEVGHSFFNPQAPFVLPPLDTMPELDDIMRRFVADRITLEQAVEQMAHVMR